MTVPLPRVAMRRVAGPAVPSLSGTTQPVVVVTGTGLVAAMTVLPGVGLAVTSTAGQHAQRSGLVAGTTRAGAGVPSSSVRVPWQTGETSARVTGLREIGME